MDVEWKDLYVGINFSSAAFGGYKRFLKMPASINDLPTFCNNITWLCRYRNDDDSEDYRRSDDVDSDSGSGK